MKQLHERQVAIRELREDPGKYINEVRRGTTLVLTDDGRRVARLIPEPKVTESREEPLIVKARGKPKTTRPKGRLRDGGSMTEIVRENRR